MKVYFNTNIYCRPFDDLSQKRILNEATASLNLFLLSSSGIIKIIASEMVLTEISFIDSIAKKDAVELLLLKNFTACISITSEADNLAKQISAKCRINDYADEIFNKSSTIEDYLKEMKCALKIRNPTKFLNELGVK